MQQVLANLPRVETADRRRFIGASEVASIIGADPFRTAFGVWASKQEDFEQEDGEKVVLLRGRFFERGVIEWAAHDLGASAIELGVPLSEPGIRGPAPWLSVRPDGALHFDGKPSVLVEAKTSDAEAFMVDGVEDVPEWYVVQALMQLACVDVEKVVVPAYLPIRRKFVCPEVVRDDALIVAILEQVDQWWHRHLDPHGPLVTPTIDGSEAATKFLRRKHPKQTQDFRAATDDEVKLVLEVQKAKAALKAAKEAEELLGNQLRQVIGDAEGLVIEGKGNVSLRWQDGARRIDADKLRAEFAAAAAACTVKGEPFRSLRFSGKGLKNND